MKHLSLFVLAGGAITHGTHAATVVDDFSGDLSAYTRTIVNDGNAAANVSFSTSGGALAASYSGASTHEQVLFLRGDYGLDVSETLTIDLSSFIASSIQDFGIVVASTATPDGDRNSLDWLSISVRPNGSGGYLRANYFTLEGTGNTGAVSYTPAGGFSSIVSLFITRTSATTFDVGYTDSTEGDVVLYSGFSFSETSGIGSAIGFYADLRTDGGSVSGFDNLTVVPEPSAALLGALGGLALMRRRRA